MEVRDDAFLIELPVWTLADANDYPINGLKSAICHMHFAGGHIVLTVFTDADLADRYATNISNDRQKATDVIIDSGGLLMEILNYSKQKGVTHVHVDPTFGSKITRRIYTIREFIDFCEEAGA